jgi:hypothetical protein
MSADKEMTLSLRIKANMAEARMHLEAFRKTLGDIGSGGRTAFSALGSAASFALGPLKVFGGIAAAAAAGTVGLGVAAIKAASDYESLQLRLESVMGSAAAAAAAFKETIKFANQTPFEAEDLIDARILLEGIGVRGVPALKATAQAAAAMGRSVSESAAMVASMETEPLRRMGIAVKRDGEQTVFNFRDKMGRMRTIATQTAESARTALLGIFNVKFGGATDRLGGSMAGVLSTLRDGMKSVFAEVGKGLLPGAKQFVTFINEGIGKLVDGGKLDEMGKRLGAWLSDSASVFQAVIEALPRLTSELSKAFREAPENLGKLLIETFKSGASILLTGIMESWKAVGGIVKGLGGIIGSSFLLAIAPHVPGLGGVVNSMARRGASGLNEMDASDLLVKNGLGQSWSAWGGSAKEMLDRSVAALPESVRTELAKRGSRDAFDSGIADAMGAIPGAMSNIGSVAAGEGARLNEMIREITNGYNLFGSVHDRASNLRRSPNGEMVDEFTVAYPGASRGYINGRFMGRDAGSTRTMRGPSGSHFQGESVGGGVIINIQTLDVRANDVRQLQNQLIKQAGPAASAAGT